DAHFERTGDHNISKLYKLITELVQDEIIICPVSPIVFQEVLKQIGNPEFLETIKIIELLSKNVLTVTEEEHIYLQYRAIYKSYLTQTSAEDFSDCVWTKAIDAFGHRIPPTQLATNNKNDDFELYKKYLDDTWDLSITELITKSAIASKGLKPEYNATEGISRLNYNNEQHKNDFSSFDDLFITERLGTLDAYKFVLWRAFVDALSSFENNYSEEKKVKIFEKLTRKSVDKKSQVPALIEIRAGVHTLIRYENWKYKDFNDIFDYHQSYNAIPFFDYFLTEKKLNNLVNHKRLQFGKKFNCIIEYKIQNAIEILNQLRKK
ncbi:MAG: hypothetical protein GY865_05525, partial [candidate division Zixibacteria bacterium]|nr:hypothetical protein [candidate division Zixibacteria bacterium]